jgi:hypothetical protein
LAPLGTDLKVGAAEEVVWLFETCAEINEADANIKAKPQTKLRDRFLMLIAGTPSNAKLD